MINCDFERCTDKCTYYESCILHHPSHFNQLQVEEELKWNVNRLNELTRGINQYKQSLYEYDRLPDEVQKYLSREKLQDLIRKSELEKQEVQSTIRELQIKELNIRKILQRRKGN
jgi:adenylosuccinate lyase